MAKKLVEVRGLRFESLRVRDLRFLVKKIIQD